MVAANYNNKEFLTIVKFGISGIFVTFVAYLAYLMFFSMTSSNFKSVLYSYILAIPLSYHLNCKFVFKKIYSLRSYSWFVFIQLMAMFLNYFILRKLNLYFEYYISAMISYGIVPVVIFLLNKILVFKND
jgi:putative flippase GtrA